ncbi:trypsin-like peptidase domain-containing protein [Plantactinospora sp. GCM10030261]|uniref:S1C family serine protease n=1 Tax=Plantactinospora sp. GCM10030261 TaxID=3273420 RepID=UPI0036150A56
MTAGYDPRARPPDSRWLTSGESAGGGGTNRPPAAGPYPPSGPVPHQPTPRRDPAPPAAGDWSAPSPPRFESRSPATADWSAPSPPRFEPSAPVAGGPSATAVGSYHPGPSFPPSAGGPHLGTPVFADPTGPPPAARPRDRVRSVLVALLVLLVTVAGVQAVQLYRLGDRLTGVEGELTAQRQADDDRLAGLEGRAGALEKQAGTVFNPEAVAKQVLPSVFRVRAGRFTGTAFAVGKPAAGGDTNLFTNFHVVEAVWRTGGRKVDLERTDQRFPATIVRVDEENDIAQLTTDASFAGLPAAGEAVRSGQQVVVVGAPLGLTDTVTTGVVSAIRKADARNGPMIQFDAPINPGNSGGPVVNGNKQVVGIATAKARDAEGIGLAVPIKVACDGFRIC